MRRFLVLFSLMLMLASCEIAGPGRQSSLNAYDGAVLNDSPVGYWPLTDTTTTVVDASGHGRNGVYHGGYTQDPSQGVLLDGTSGYIEIPDNDAFSVVTNRALTIEAWIAPATTAMPSQESSGYVLWAGKGAANNYEWVCRMYQDGNTEGRANRISGYAYPLAGGSGIGSYFQDPVVPGQWIHYVLEISYDGTDVTTTLFKNGVQRDTDTAALTLRNGAAPVRIGTRNFTSYFQGRVWGFAIYPTALTPARVAAHYTAGSEVLTTNAS